MECCEETVVVMSRPFRKSNRRSAAGPSDGTSSASQRYQLPPEITGCCGCVARWKLVREKYSTEQAAYLMINRRVAQSFGIQLLECLLLLITCIAASNSFSASTSFITPYYGAPLLKLLWFVFVVHLGAGLLGGLLWWRRLVLKGYFLFTYFLLCLGCFVISLWALLILFKAIGAVFNIESNDGDEKPIFSWLAILLISCTLVSFAYSIALIRYWRAMESEALDPRKPTSEGGRVAADVLAAHAAASTGAGVFPTSHSSPKKPKRAKKEKMTGKEVERAPPIAFQHGVNDMEMGGPMGAPDSAPVGGGAKYVIDMPNPMSSPQSVHSAAAPVDEPQYADYGTPPPRVHSKPVLVTPATGQFGGEQWEDTGNVSGGNGQGGVSTWSPEAVLPPISNAAVIQALSPQQFEASWLSMAESGSFDCGVSQVPEKYALMSHLESRGFRVVATGVVDGNLKVYFYGTGSTMIAAGQGSQTLKPTTVFLAEFLFVVDTNRLSAKFKCSDESATGTFVRRFRLQMLFSVTADPAAV